MIDWRKGACTLALLVSMGAAGCAAELGGEPEEIAVEPAALLSPDAGVAPMALNPSVVQEAMQRENQLYSSISNVLKTRHDTAKSSISNIR
jgi:hypothetical protein